MVFGPRVNKVIHLTGYRYSVYIDIVYIPRVDEVMHLTAIVPFRRKQLHHPIVSTQQ